MPTRWETFPVEFTGGLVSNLSRLQQGLKQPGSARLLQNFEPSIEGGYRRINGFTKFDPSIVPPYGFVLVQGSGQTGTTLVVGNIHEAPSVADTFTITVSGVPGTYTVTGVSYSEVNKEASLTITPALASSPLDKADVTFISGVSRIEGVFYSAGLDKAYVLRGGFLWSSTGSGWTLVNIENYGTTLVKGGGQTGTTLIMDGFVSDEYLPEAGDTFTIEGVEKVYTVLTLVGSAGGNATLSIYPALVASPADNAVITFRASSHQGGTKARFTEFNFNGTFKVAMVDGFNEPAIISGTSYRRVKNFPDVRGAQYVEVFKDHIFFGKDDLVSFSAPFEEENFTPADGAGSYRLPNNCTGLITFRDQMINFSETSIRRLQGSSVSDFTISSIANNFGCVNGDTVQEVGGDVLFLGPDGVRFLGATERIGDFNLSLASRQIQSDFNSFISSTADFCTLVIREKNQYRLFKYVDAQTKETSEGYIGTQFLDQNAQSINWGSTLGIKAYRAASVYLNDNEIVIFSNDDGYLYTMESGSTFDGAEINSKFYSPFMAVNDPSIRKTAYTVATYFDPEGPVTGKVTLKYDFNQPGKIQPNAVNFSGGGNFTTWGSFVWGTGSYGGLPDTVLQSNVTGSFFTVSFQYEFEGGPPFVLDTVLLEYSTEDRK